MIAVRGIGVRAGGHEILHDVTFDLVPNTFTAVLGANGAGKTTLARAVAGLQRVASGALELDGRALVDLRPNERARRIAYMASDDAVVEGMSVRDVVATARYAYHEWWDWTEHAGDARAIAAALDAVAMEAFTGRGFESLSSGERQRVWLAAGLAQEAPLLVLDEATSHLDVRVAHEILQLLREQRDLGKTVVCV
ncbi:MAG: ABC transporter ATP-binding protein, partial [Candidatus Eremiobacteraeota bacterium]|nr:ABC transporter ATP-binding protein [Candidatus Eremiobacteraeota bacterium]